MFFLLVVICMLVACFKCILYIKRLSAKEVSFDRILKFFSEIKEMYDFVIEKFDTIYMYCKIDFIREVGEKGGLTMSILIDQQKYSPFYCVCVKFHCRSCIFHFCTFIFIAFYGGHPLEWFLAHTFFVYKRILLFNTKQAL